MAKTRMKIAALNEDELAKVRSMEESLGTLILALEPQRKMAELTPEQVAQLQRLEKELGVILIAYDPDQP
ncbi:MAG TPA: hypothetical protein VIO61_17455 [Anaerolineaceae bacterium]